MTRSRKVLHRTAPLLAAVALLLVATADAFGLPPFTTAPKTAGGGPTQAEVFGLTASCGTKGATFDRVVIRVHLASPGYDVRYVNRVIADPSGMTLALLGVKRILATVRPARGHSTSGTNLLPAVRTPLCSNLRQVKTAGDFEGVVSFGLGLRRRTGFRVYRLTAPSRIVIDIAH